MVFVEGLVGLRPRPEVAAACTSPPYDVIKAGSPLEAQLKNEPRSVYHVILGDDPAAALARLQEEGSYLRDDEPAYYVYEQNWVDGRRGEEQGHTASPTSQRTGVIVAAAVTDYEEKQIIRHEKTFDDKVQGRIALTEATQHTLGPVFVLSKAPDLGAALAAAKAGEPLYDFRSHFEGGSDLSGVHTRIFRVPAASKAGRRIQAVLEPHPLYIADGHHRYHAALRNRQSHFLAYVTSEARILAYDRVIRGKTAFENVRAELPLQAAAEFKTPEKHRFCIYAQSGVYTLKAERIPSDVVGRLDCAILERELYPKLGLTHEHIADAKHFDYYPESALDAMKASVDAGTYDIAVALHPVAVSELMAVADAGLEDPDIVMPEKSTFFSPKILTGLFLYRHRPAG